ncbi:DPP IV N-terminal domain-containing protein [Saccharomonospora sp. NPDC046836]|uniref:S9 family peptidase n=1 Tax=Saccharomonospora sp. NPDC046836 TaxID=3156921 RepID=UPI0033C66ECF
MPSSPSELTDRYRQAHALVPERLPGLMCNQRIVPQWTGEGDRFWHRRNADGGGFEYVLVDPDGFRREPLFDPAELAPRLAAVFGSPVDLATTAVVAYRRGDNSDVYIGLEDGRRAVLSPVGDRYGDVPEPGALTGPDSRRHVFRRGDDLWLRDLGAGSERRLTSDGEPFRAWGATPDYSRALLPLAVSDRVSPPAMTCFSPSGRWVLTARLDERDTPEHPFVDQLPADRALPRLRPVRYHHEDETAKGDHQLAFIDVETGEHTVLDTGRDLLSTLSSVGADSVTWASDESAVYLFVHGTGARTASLVRIDVQTGDQTVVLTETADPMYEPNTHLYSLPLIRVLPKSNEVIWFSQEDGWGHLYRHDLTTGARLGAITSGNLVVRDILRVDEERRTVIFVAGCGDDERNPYWRTVFRADLDGGEQTLLTPEPADHELIAPAPQFFAAIFGDTPASSISPSGKWFVDHMSTVSTPPTILLRDTLTGAVAGELERADVTALLHTGFAVPEQFHVTADDGETELWGLITLPRDVPAGSLVPVVDLMYAGFQVVTQPSGWLTGGANPAWGQLGAAYAALGFATVVLDGRGTPGRDRGFRQWTHGVPAEPRGIEDHVTAIRALADRYPIDLERVGVTGHSYGGYNSVRSMLYFPDFFTVAVSSAGVHDARKMPKGSWNWFLGDGDPHDPQALADLGNLHLAERLRGRLLLLCGDNDANATMDHTLALVRAFMDADRRFDLKIWPGGDHYNVVTPYTRTIMWDYFVEYLLGERPPAGTGR